ncbi:MAG: hypothetical protein ACI4PP_01555 [Clostridia bacterium]
MEQQLTEALIRRKDRYALEIIREHPELINESVVRLALDHGCVRVIRYLRSENRITMDGKEQRDNERREEVRRLLSEADQGLPAIEKYFKR